MLQFLPYIAMGLSALSSMSAAKNAGKASAQTPAERAAMQALANRDRLLKAYLNPEDPIMKNLSVAENKQLNEYTQQGLSNLLAMNRKAKLMGRTSYFDPERQDESIMQYLSKANVENQNVARNNALNRIMAAANGYGTSSGNYQGFMEPQLTRQGAQANQQSNMLSGLSSLFQSGGSLSNLMSMFGNSGGGGGGSFLASFGGS